MIIVVGYHNLKQCLQLRLIDRIRIGWSFHHYLLDILPTNSFWIKQLWVAEQ